MSGNKQQSDLHELISGTLHTLKALVNNLADAIRKDHKAQHSANHIQPPPPTVIATLHLPPEASEYYRAKASKKPRPKGWRYTKRGLQIAGILIALVIAILTLYTLREVKKQADATQGQLEIAKDQFLVGERPWVKITHRIVKPLNFGFVGAAGPAATMTVESTMENVGPTVALHVLTWEDVIPEDYEWNAICHCVLPSDKSASARLEDWCGTNQNSEQSRNPSGNPGLSTEGSPDVIRVVVCPPHPLRPSWLGASEESAPND